ncbi:MAG: hypothetical protein R3C03_01305 [Pirellulaceae bacterium]
MSHCKAFDVHGKKLLEGFPVPIDHRVTWKRQDVLDSRDPVLEKALLLIQSRQTAQK